MDKKGGKFITYFVKKSESIYLENDANYTGGSATLGQRAKFGPRLHYVWPEDVFQHLLTNIEKSILKISITSIPKISIISILKII